MCYLYFISGDRKPDPALWDVADERLSFSIYADAINPLSNPQQPGSCSSLRRPLQVVDKASSQKVKHICKIGVQNIERAGKIFIGSIEEKQYR